MRSKTLEDEAEGEVMTPCSKEPVEVGAAAGVSLCGKPLGIFMDFVILLRSKVKLRKSRRP